MTLNHLNSLKLLPNKFVWHSFASGQSEIIHYSCTGCEAKLKWCYAGKITCAKKDQYALPVTLCIHLIWKPCWPEICAWGDISVKLYCTAFCTFRDTLKVECRVSGGKNYLNFIWNFTWILQRLLQWLFFATWIKCLVCGSLQALNITCAMLYMSYRASILCQKSHMDLVLWCKRQHILV